MKIKIVEVGPRDGLQNEKEILTLEQRAKFIQLLLAAGHKNIEVGAFVRADLIPQMAHTAELFKLLNPFPQDVRLSALVPNLRGYEDAAKSGFKDISVFTAASETFNKKNTNASIEESLNRFQEFLSLAKKAKIRVRGYVSTCFGCPYEGAVPERNVLRVTEKLLELGIKDISIGDTIGVANPTQVKSLVKKLIRLTGAKSLAMHFHDTRGTALANILSAFQNGITTFDSSTGGVGGCPYAPGASGNVATEDVAYMFQEMGHPTGIDLGKNVLASRYLESVLHRGLPSRYLQSVKH